MPADTPQQAWSRGFDDATKGIPLTANPYQNGKLRFEWRDGHAEGLKPDPKGLPGSAATKHD